MNEPFIVMVANVTNSNWWNSPVSWAMLSLCSSSSSSSMSSLLLSLIRVQWSNAVQTCFQWHAGYFTRDTKTIGVYWWDYQSLDVVCRFYDVNWLYLFLFQIFTAVECFWWCQMLFLRCHHDCVNICVQHFHSKWLPKTIQLSHQPNSFVSKLIYLCDRWTVCAR